MKRNLSKNLTTRGMQEKLARQLPIISTSFQYSFTVTSDRQATPRKTPLVEVKTNQIIRQCQGNWSTHISSLTITYPQNPISQN